MEDTTIHPLTGSKQSEEHKRNRIESRLKNNPNYHPKGWVVWNKGKTKETDERVKKYSENLIKGKKFHTAGYIEVYFPEHPNAVRGYVMEHRAEMERKIGRYLLPKEQVHHINGIVDDNRISNLQLITIGEHSRLHGIGRKMPKESLEKRRATNLKRYGKIGFGSTEQAMNAWKTRRKNLGL